MEGSQNKMMPYAEQHRPQVYAVLVDGQPAEHEPHPVLWHLAGINIWQQMLAIAEGS
jgi:hypothetical protein